MNLEELRGWLAARLKTKSIPDKVWDRLVKDGMAKANLDDNELEDLVYDATRRLEAWRDGRSSSSGTRRPGRLKKDYQEFELSEWLDAVEVERIRVVEKHVARMAAKHPDVQSFRTEILGDKFPLTYEEALEEFVDEDGAVHGDSPYAKRLAELARELSKVYFWEEISASWFLLTGYTPPMKTFGLKTSSTCRPYGPQVETITLTVEPWLSAKKVQKIYKGLQDRILGKSNRRVGLKSLALLEFVADSDSGSSWRKLLEKWNSTNPEWKFTIKNPDRDPDKAVRDFQAAYERARERVIDPQHEQPKGFGWSLSRGERQ